MSQDKLYIIVLALDIVVGTWLWRMFLHLDVLRSLWSFLAHMGQLKSNSEFLEASHLFVFQCIRWCFKSGKPYCMIIPPTSLSINASVFNVLNLRVLITWMLLEIFQVWRKLHLENCWLRHLSRECWGLKQDHCM